MMRVCDETSTLLPPGISVQNYLDQNKMGYSLWKTPILPNQYIFGESCSKYFLFCFFLFFFLFTKLSITLHFHCFFRLSQGSDVSMGTVASDSPSTPLPSGVGYVDYDKIGYI